MLQQIELYLDDELAVSVRLEVEQHLGGCHPCSGHAEFQRRLKAMLRSKCGCDEVPAHLLERVRSLLEHQRDHP